MLCKRYLCQQIPLVRGVIYGLTNEAVSNGPKASTTMNPKTDKLLQQAGKYIALGKLTLALEQYLKIQESEPDDTTIVNTIGDLYVRLDDKDNALLWYHKLAEGFEYR